MPTCISIHLQLWAIMVVLTAAVAPPVEGFVINHSQGQLVQFPVGNQRFMPTKIPLTETRMVAENVEVCGFKDCKSRGGGDRLVKQIGEILEEKSLTSSIALELCDCQGECGYGPNVVIDGKIVNQVKGREAILKALGIED